MVYRAVVYRTVVQWCTEQWLEPRTVVTVVVLQHDVPVPITRVPITTTTACPAACSLSGSGVCTGCGGVTRLLLVTINKPAKLLVFMTLKPPKKH